MFLDDLKARIGGNLVFFGRRQCGRYLVLDDVKSCHKIVLHYSLQDHVVSHLVLHLVHALVCLTHVKVL